MCQLWVVLAYIQKILDNQRNIGQILGFFIPDTQSSEDTHYLQVALQAHEIEVSKELLSSRSGYCRTNLCLIEVIQGPFPDLLR